MQSPNLDNVCRGKGASWRKRTTKKEGDENIDDLSSATKFLEFPHHQGQQTRCVHDYYIYMLTNVIAIVAKRRRPESHRRPVDFSQKQKINLYSTRPSQNVQAKEKEHTIS